MRNLRSIVLGLGIAILSISVILGSLSLALLEGSLAGNSTTMIKPSETTLAPTLIIISNGPTFTSLPPTSTKTLPPTPEACPPPSGWIPIMVNQNENLDILSRRYNISIEQLRQANCLTTSDLTVGSILYVLPLPTATKIPCGPPAGWITYIVKPKDTLFHISTLYQTTFPILQAGNCMGSSTLIITGQRLFVPNVATITPTRTFTPTVTSTTVIPLLTLDKTSTTLGFSLPGTIIDYNYNLRNTGALTLNGPFSVSDNKTTVSCPATTSLAPNGSITCTSTYTTTQNDLDSGAVTNLATGHAFYNGNQVDSNLDSLTVSAVQTTGLTLDKSSLTASYVLAGESLNYTYNLKNTGNVTLIGPFTVSDDKTAVVCPATTSLAPNSSINCTSSYSVTQNDVNTGYVMNIASGHAFFNSNSVNSNQDSVTINATIPVGMLPENSLFAI